MAGRRSSQSRSPWQVGVHVEYHNTRMYHALCLQFWSLGHQQAVYVAWNNASDIFSLKAQAHARIARPLLTSCQYQTIEPIAWCSQFVPDSNIAVCVYTLVKLPSGRFAGWISVHGVWLFQTRPKREIFAEGCRLDRLCETEGTATEHNGQQCTNMLVHYD